MENKSPSADYSFMRIRGGFVTANDIPNSFAAPKAVRLGLNFYSPTTNSWTALWPYTYDNGNTNHQLAYRFLNGVAVVYFELTYPDAGGLHGQSLQLVVFDGISKKTSNCAQTNYPEISDRYPVFSKNGADLRVDSDVPNGGCSWLVTSDGTIKSL